MIEARLAERGVVLPPAPAPSANYVPWAISGNLLFIAGQGPHGPDGTVRGRVGEDLTIEQGYDAARRVGLNLIAQMQAATGDLDRVARVVKLFGMVRAVPEFAEHPAVINGASDLMVEVFGDAGRHARSAVGMASLPWEIAVEIEAVVELKP